MFAINAFQPFKLRTQTFLSGKFFLKCFSAGAALWNRFVFTKAKEEEEKQTNELKHISKNVKNLQNNSRG